MKHKVIDPHLHVYTVNIAAKYMNVALEVELSLSAVLSNPDLLWALWAPDEI